VLDLNHLLDERTFPLSHLRLAILSACQTAQSDFQRLSEEAIGLLGAFLYAGAAGVVGTLWPVYDTSSSALIESFARRHLIEGMDPTSALRAAQNDLRMDEKRMRAELGARKGLEEASEGLRAGALAASARATSWEHPLHWAAFVYYGA
jgi:CHAT domain-containing protein